MGCTVSIVLSGVGVHSVATINFDFDILIIFILKSKIIVTNRVATLIFFEFAIILFVAFYKQLLTGRLGLGWRYKML